MIICGIDPGTARIGWAIISSNGSSFNSIAFGCITTDKSLSPETRLRALYEEIKQILQIHKPTVMSVEELFFSTNAKTAIAVGQARGVVLLSAALAGIPVVSYTPMIIKQSICGTGAADKTQVQYMVKNILKLKKIPEPDDAADAVAAALTHAFCFRMKERTL